MAHLIQCLLICIQILQALALNLSRQVLSKFLMDQLDLFFQQLEEIFSWDKGEELGITMLQK